MACCMFSYFQRQKEKHESSLTRSTTHHDTMQHVTFSATSDDGKRATWNGIVQCYETQFPIDGMAAY